jgi:hypothetical protein
MKSHGKIVDIEDRTGVSTKDGEKIVVLDDSPPLLIITRSFATSSTDALSSICKILPIA